jgi:hypothetical protein
MVMSGYGNVSIAAKDSIPAVDLTNSYSVSAWVTMTDSSGWRTFVSADGSAVSEFYLQKRADTNEFGFTLSTSDSNDGVVSPCVAWSMFVPEAGTCSADRDGVAWPASTIGIGYGMYSGSKTDYFSGSISGVGLVGRVLTADEVAALYALGPG